MGYLQEHVGRVFVTGARAMGMDVHEIPPNEKYSRFNVRSKAQAVEYASRYWRLVDAPLHQYLRSSPVHAVHDIADACLLLLIMHIQVRFPAPCFVEEQRRSMPPCAGCPRALALASKYGGTDVTHRKGSNVTRRIGPSIASCIIDMVPLRGVNAASSLLLTRAQLRKLAGPSQAADLHKFLGVAMELLPTRDIALAFRRPGDLSPRLCAAVAGHPPRAPPSCCETCRTSLICS